VRAKKNYVAYVPAESEPDKTPRRPKQYGDTVALMEVFEHLELFTYVSCRLYGQVEEVAIATANRL
jgi:hypothetical protein